MSNFELRTTNENWQTNKKKTNKIAEKLKLLEAAITLGVEETRKMQKLLKHRSFEKKNPVNSDL